MIAINETYIKKWLVLGPFFPDDLEVDFLVDIGGEANVVPKESDTITTEDVKTLEWKRYESKIDAIDLIDAIGDYEHATAYAFCILQSQVEADAQIHLGSDDGVAVWINGEQVHAFLEHRELNYDEDCFEAHLAVGANRCLIKVSNVTELWSFTMRLTMLHPARAVISGIVTNEKGDQIPNAEVRLKQREEEIARTLTDSSGGYRLNVHPVSGSYDLSVTAGELGDWQLDIPLHEGERRSLNFTLKESISIEGKLLTLDDKAPHVAVAVQAVRNGKVVATDLTLNLEGRYRFINLKPGKYQVRCYTPGGYVYYQDGESEVREDVAEILNIESGKTLENIDFQFPHTQKGTWKHYAEIDGLASMAVHNIHEDPKGNLWFGSQSYHVEGSGVSRYDGKEFTVFTTEDGLMSNIVWAICGSLDGTIWFGTRGRGVCRYDGKDFATFTTEDGLAGNVIWVIHCDPDGVMWFGTDSGGVSRYANSNGRLRLTDGKKFVNLAIKDGLPHNDVRAIYSEPNGVMWFGTWGGGVCRYDGEKFVNFSQKDGLVSNRVCAIYRDPDGVMWFGTEDGISRYDGNEFRNLTTEDGLLNNWVNAIHRDPDGVMWFGVTHISSRGGVSRYDGKGFVNFTIADELLYGSVECIHRDAGGGLWFGTGFGGASRYDGESIITLTTKDGLLSNFVQATHRDADGALWIGTTEGITRYDNGDIGYRTPVNFLASDELPLWSISAIQRAPDGTMWFGTGGINGTLYGLFRYEGDNEDDSSSAFVRFTTEDGLADNRIMDICCDADGVMWFATNGGGVSRYDEKRFVNLTTEDGLAGNRVWAIHCDNDGIMWFSTNDGVSQYDGKKFVNLTTEDGLVSDVVTAIQRAPDGVMWFGTWGNGIYRYDGEEFVNFTIKDGLTSNSVCDIYCDSDGVTWFATFGGGVDGYDGVAWTSLDTRYGLGDNRVFSLEPDTDGSLWFGTFNGLTRYRKSKIPPRIHIISVTTDQTYRALDDIPACAVGTRVTIEYNAIDFKTLPEKRQYRCRIKEIDSDWRKPTKADSFHFSFDEPGTYTFLVQAIDRELNYSSPATVRLEVIDDSRDQQIAELERELERRNRELEAELQDAHNVQMSLMPETAPEIEGVEIAGRCLPANTVSGDFFDYLEGKHPHEIALVVADVMGKAMQGAMNAMMASGILRMAAKGQEQLSPSSLMMEINDVLKARTSRLMNVTMVIAVIDDANKILTIANAGILPLLWRDGKVLTLKLGDLPLGMIAGIEYTEEQFLLQSSDVVILMTDGIIEVQNSDEQFYSDSGRLEETIRTFTLKMSAEAMIDTIIADAINFGGDKASRDDDMTIVVAKLL